MTHTGKHVTDLIRPSADVLLRVRKRNYFAIINTQHKHTPHAQALTTY